MKQLFFFFTFTLLFACESKKIDVTANSKAINEFFDRRFDESVMRNPEFASSLGIKSLSHLWSERTEAHWDSEMAIQKEGLDSLKKHFDIVNVDAQTKLSIRLYEEDVKKSKDGLKWRHHGYWITQMGGEHNDIPSFLINIHNIDTLSDALSYISRVQKIPTVFNQVIDGIKKSEAIGVTPPLFTFSYVQKDIEEMIKSISTNNDAISTDFESKVLALKLDKKISDSLIAVVKNEMKINVSPAYTKLLEYWKSYNIKATASNGVWSLPNGVDFYNYCLRENTTTQMTSDEVHDLGIKEVARIHIEMRKIMKQVKFKNDSLQDFFNFVRSDKQFKYAPNESGRKTLLEEANKYVAQIKEKLPQLFGILPKAELVVKPVEAFREKSAGGAFYEDPALDGSRPGRYYVNLFNMDDNPKYQLEALTAHEAVPGHHMQIAIAQELTTIPKFRRYMHNTAYIEGWALYAETLPKELGFYQNPYSDFGRLSMEVFRAARLVVDVSIHTKKWTREQAIEYFVANTANAKGDIDKEIERYFLWPGQATGYKIGMIKIQALRAKAEKEMGAKFDIRKFHDIVIGNGAVPLTVLEELIDEYIKLK
jgi:uncharacterized protein (DUF885 family)